MRVLLVKPPSHHRDSRLEPLGLCYIAAVCRDAGHDVRIVDVFEPNDSSIADMFQVSDCLRPEVVGISAMTEEFKAGLEIAGVMKLRYEAKTIFGGWHVSGNPSEAARPEIDYVVRGEGEDTILELLEFLEGNGRELDGIEGIAYSIGDSVHLTPPRSRIRKLDRLPIPMREGLPIGRYRMPGMWAYPFSKTRTLSVQASRGCPYTCGFCQTPAVWSNIWAKRSAKSVVDEVEDLVNRYKINTLFFRDEEFTIRNTFVHEICDEMIRRKLPSRLKWGNFARVDDITEDLTRAMRDAGCVWMFMGLEAASPEHAQKINKFFKQREARNALEICRRMGILVQSAWIIGFPWDTEESLNNAYNWLQSLPLDFLEIFFATPFAGTDLEKLVRRENLLLSSDTDSYDIRSPIIAPRLIPVDRLRRLQQKFKFRFHLRPKGLWRTVTFLAKEAGRARMMAELIFNSRSTRLPDMWDQWNLGIRARTGPLSKYADSLANTAVYPTNPATAISETSTDGNFRIIPE